MSYAFALALSIVCAGIPPAHAERAIAADVQAGAPFDAGELVRALRVRLPRDGDAVHVRVTPTPTGVQIAARDGVRDVDVAGLHGPAAARLVALAASDLLLADIATMPIARRDAGLVVALGAIGHAAAWTHPLGGAAIDATLAAAGGRALFALEVGGATLLADELRLTAATVRAGGGLRAGPFVELRGGLTLAPIFVADGAGDRTVLAGANASVRLRLPLAPRVRAILAGGVDVFATRTEYHAAGMPVLTTPRTAPWLAAGVEVTP